MPIKIFSFFAGLGFLDLGFENAGFNISFVNEKNSTFLSSYKYARRNRNYSPVYGYSDNDIRDYLSSNKWNATFQDYNNRNGYLIGFIGGPPCPDFSVAGKNKGQDGKNGILTSVYFEIIKLYKPDFFLFENVKGLYRTKKHRSFYEDEKSKLREAGYILFDSIENSLEYGVPQYRDRLFLVGFLKSKFGEKVKFNMGSHKKYILEDVLTLDWPKTNPFFVDMPMMCPKHIQEELTVEYWFKKNMVDLHKNSRDFFGIKSIDKYLKTYEGDISGKSFKRLHRWRYSPTAAYGNNEVHLHPYKLRRISVAEALAIQSAPADFEIPDKISLSAKFRMVSNGVPVLLAQGIAKDILDTVKDYAGGV